MQGTALVVMECGSDWPAHLHRGLDLVALRQEADEHEDALLRRTSHRVHAFEEMGGRIHRAVLSCNNDMTSATLENRALIARLLLSSVLHVDEGRLFLVANASSPLRLALLALADTLTMALTGTSACVSALFVGGPRRDSLVGITPSDDGVNGGGNLGAHIGV